MSRRKPFKDPVKRAEKRRRQKESFARGEGAKTPKQPRPSQSQMTHASSSAMKKKAREGQRKLDRERGEDT